jgi:hypothetical protein
MYASSSSQLTRLGIGSTNAVLTVSGGIPAWDTTWTPAGDLLPSADDSYDLGSASAAWQDLFLEGDITLTDAGTIATSAGALTVNGAGGINLQEGGATIIGISDSRAVSTSNTASVDLDASGAIQINSSGGALSVGNDNVDQNVNIATAGTRTLNIGINDGTDLTTITSKGNITNTGTLTVGVDDTGYDVKFFGASAGAYMEWDESADQLRIVGPSADATTSTGKLLLATALTDINANDVIGKIDFQAPLEAGGTDAIAIAASIQAVAQATFSSSVNSTDLLFMTGDSEAATEKFRITSQGELGVGGANYGSSGDVLTSGGAGSAPSWATPTTGDITGVTAGNGLSGGGTSGGVSLALDLSELTDTAIAHGDYIVFTDTTDSNASVKGDLADVATLFAGTGLTASSSVIGVDTSQAITALTGGDLTIYEDANNADVSLKMGTSATESLTIQVLNGGSNKTAEEVHFSTATASGTADHGKMVFDVDGADIVTIDDGGLNVGTGSLETATIDYTDGDLAMTIADGGGVTFAQNTTFEGIIDITDTTDASDASGDTGALRTEGGASIAKKLYVGTDLDVDGTAELDNITIGGAQGSDGQVLTSTGSAVAWEDAASGGGITQASTWLMTSDFDPSSDGTITANLSEKSSAAGRWGKIGSSMTESSGIFTFPATGIWMVTWGISIYGSGNDTVCLFTIQTSNDGFSSDSNDTGRILLAKSANEELSGYASIIMDVTNTSNDKVRFRQENVAANITIAGAVNNNTWFEFVRLGDT